MLDRSTVRASKRSAHTAMLIAGVAAVLTGSAYASAAGGTVCTVVSGPGLKRQSGRIGKIDASNVQLTSTDGRQAMNLPLADVVWIDCAAGKVDASGRSKQQEPHDPGMPSATGVGRSDDLLLILRDGEAFRGMPSGLTGDSIEWKARYVGPRTVPLKDVVAITRANSADAATSSAVATSDELRLANGDVVTGVVTAADEKTVTCQSPDGQAVPIEWTNVRSIRLATPAGASERAPDDADQAFRVHVNDGSVLRCATLTFDGGDAIAITSAGKSATIRAAMIESIEHANAKVRLLSLIAPATHSYEPFFPRTTNAPIADPATISIAGSSTRSFIAARPHTRLTWPLDGSAARFRTRYGIPDGRRSANAVVRVLLDDRVVHERADLTSGTLADAIDIDLAGAKSLTLEVDFGGAFDVQDQVYWFEPVLIGK